MDTKNLCTLVTIIETGSFQKAAMQLNYAPSTVTSQMRQLEEELLIKLSSKGLPILELNFIAPHQRKPVSMIYNEPNANY